VLTGWLRSAIHVQANAAVLPLGGLLSNDAQSGSDPLGRITGFPEKVVPEIAVPIASVRYADYTAMWFSFSMSASAIYHQLNRTPENAVCAQFSRKFRKTRFAGMTLRYYREADI
jgi:hypothetical protein